MSRYTHIYLIGTSSAGKTSLTNEFPEKYTRIRIDDYHEKYYNDIYKAVLSHVDNNYLGDNRLRELTWMEIEEIMKKDIKKAKYAVIDDITLNLIKFAPKNKYKAFYIYAPLKDMIRNIKSRRSKDPRGLNAIQQMAHLYTATCSKKLAIDTISRPQFIKELNKVRWLFESYDTMVDFVIDICMHMGIVTDEPHMIKPRHPLDGVINTTGLSIKKIYSKLQVE